MSSGLADPGAFPDRLFLGSIAPEVSDLTALVDRRRALIEKRLSTLDHYHAAQSRENHSPLPYDIYCRAVENLERVATQISRDETRQQRNPDGFRLEPLPGLNRLLNLGRRTNYTPDLKGWTAYLSDLHPEFGTAIGALKQPSALPENSRAYHSLVVAPTGWGKSELLKALLYHYARHQIGGVLVLDPGGDLVREVRRWPVVAPRLVLIDPELEPGQTVGINPLDGRNLTTEDARREVAAHWALTLGEIADDLSFNMQRIAGDCARVLLSEPGATVRDFIKLLDQHPSKAMRGTPPDDPRGQRLWELSRNYPDYDVATFFRTDFDSDNYVSTRIALRGRIDWILKLPHTAAMLCASKTLNLKEAFEHKKIVLVNLAAFKKLGSTAMGRLFIALVNGIGRSRDASEKTDRIPLHVFVDEVSTMVSPQMLEVLTELRKFGVHLTMAQQVDGQGFTAEHRRVLKANTGCKFVGGEPEHVADTGDLIGLKKNDVPILLESEFLVRWRGTDQLRRLRVRSDLADGKAEMSDQKWAEVRHHQLREYYRAIEQPPPLEPVSATQAKAGVATDSTTSRGHKKRELRD